MIKVLHKTLPSISGIGHLKLYLQLTLIVFILYLNWLEELKHLDLTNHIEEAEEDKYFLFYFSIAISNRMFLLCVNQYYNVTLIEQK